MPGEPIKPVVWLGDSLRVLRSFPAGVQEEIGYALYLAQRGEKHVSAKEIDTIWRRLRLAEAIREGQG